MKAAIYAGIGEIGIQDVERKNPPPGFVLVDTKCSGICGSDLHSYAGRWSQSGKVASGHELCGVIVETGDGVTGFKRGDRVTTECFSHCGKCAFCRTGFYNLCIDRPGSGQEAHGGFAEYSTLHESGLYKLPENMSFEEGAMVEPLAVAHRAVAQSAGVHSGAPVRRRLAVIGGGTIGLLCLAVAKAAGIRETLITAKYDRQIAVAEALGADYVVRAGETDLVQHVKEIANGFGMDAVIETVGTGQTFNDSMEIVRKRGAVVLLAGYHKALEVDIGRVVSTEAVVTGSNCYGYSGMKTDFQASIALIADGHVDVGKLVTHRFSLDEIGEAFRIAADKSSGSIKVHVCQ